MKSQIVTSNGWLVQLVRISYKFKMRMTDCFLCIDDTVYHIGASLKDLGKKWFAFGRMEIGTDALLQKM